MLIKQLKKIIDMINIIIFNALFREMRTKKINKFSIFSANFVNDLQNTIYFMKNAVDEGLNF